MKKLHIQHTAFDKTLRNARSMYFWPGMKNDIKLMVSSCDRCLENSPSQRQEPLVQTVASRLMEQTSIDLAQYGGKTYLVLADRFSGWILVEKYAKSPDQMAVCNTLNIGFWTFITQSFFVLVKLTIHSNEREGNIWSGK